VVTNIIPDFKAERWVGLLGEITDNPFLPICRSQIDIRFRCDSQLLADRMPGFHWMTGYGDYLREVGYALKRIPITWEVLGYLFSTRRGRIRKNSEAAVVAGHRAFPNSCGFGLPFNEEARTVRASHTVRI
jgi:hypothetical protein